MLQSSMTIGATSEEAKELIEIVRKASKLLKPWENKTSRLWIREDLSGKTVVRVELDSNSNSCSVEFLTLSSSFRLVSGLYSLEIAKLVAEETLLLFDYKSIQL